MADYRDLELGGKPRMRAHSIHIDNRSRSTISGVSDVESFNEQEIVLATEGGYLRIEGEGLHLSKLNLEDGQVAVEGEIIALEYEPPVQERKGLFGKVFR